jgi:DNA repair exonuclease SbcCD ATPase subunit
MGQNAVDTGTGFIAGVEPAQPRNAMDWPTQNAAQSVSQPIQAVVTNGNVPNGVTTNSRFFSEEDIEKARQQEKDKLYPRLNQMEEQLKAMQKEREELARQKDEEALRLSAEAKRKEEAELEVRDLLSRKEQEWNDRFQQLEKKSENDRAVYEMEKRLGELERYRSERIQQDAEEILPELRDYIRGNTIEEIDQSIEDAKARTNAIVGNISAVTYQQQMPMPRGASPTAPPVGPLEQMQTYQSLTPEDIRSMDIETYKRYRDSLLAQARNQYRGR